MFFFVQYSRRRGHPLNVAGADATVVTRGITMLKLALVNYGYGFEAAMGCVPTPRGGASDGGNSVAPA